MIPLFTQDCAGNSSALMMIKASGGHTLHEVDVMTMYSFAYSCQVVFEHKCYL